MEVSIPPRAKSSWSPDEIRAHMKAHPQRAYFRRLFREGGFRVGMEVGVADGRFSEHFLLGMNDTVSDWPWHMVEPFPNGCFTARVHQAGGNKFCRDMKLVGSIATWEERGIGKTVGKHFYESFSTDKDFIAQVPDKSLDFLYLDGAHSYGKVKLELVLMFRKVRPGGVLAGHDYCNHGEPALGCKGCQEIPLCQPYTEYGVKHGKRKGGRAMNQQGVVKAVQEYLVETHPEVELLHTVEIFTRESLAQDGMDYDLVITNILVLLHS